MARSNGNGLPAAHHALPPSVVGAGMAASPTPGGSPRRRAAARAPARVPGAALTPTTHGPRPSRPTTRWWHNSRGASRRQCHGELPGYGLAMPTSGGTDGSFASTARNQVEHILSRPPYSTSGNGPRPLAGIFRALGRALDAVFGPPFRWLYHHVLVHMGNGFTVAFGGWWPVVAAVIAVLIGALSAVALVRRRARVPRRAMLAGRLLSVDDPGALEAEASAAESAGDYERAVRLRYQAGLLQLARQGTLADDAARTDRQLAELVGSAIFEQLARRHERIVYGGQPAVAEDSAAARRDWPRVLVEARANNSGQ